MQIAVLLRHFNKNGGASRSTIEICEHLARKGHNITVYTFSYDVNIGKDYTFIKVFYPFFFKYIKNKYILLFFENPLFAVLTTIHLIFKKRFELVWSPMGHTFYKGLFTAQSCHKALIRQKIANKEFKWIFNPLHFWGLILDYYNYKNNIGITSISNVLRNDIICNYSFLKKENIKVIHHGVNTNEFKPQKKEIKDKYRDEFNCKSDDIILLFVGYEHKRKGLFHILNVIPSLPDNVKILVAGKDSLNKKYLHNIIEKNNIQSKVNFLGSVKDLSKLYALADIFVFPSHMDAFGLVIIEAMASGLPIITTNVTGCSELMKDNSNGFVIDFPVEENELKEKLECIIKNTDLRECMSLKSREIAEKYSWKIIGEQYENFFTSQIRS